MGIRIRLNLRRHDNYSFFDPDAPLSLSISKPIGTTNRLTPSIIRGLSYGSLIDMDNVVDKKTWTIKGVTQGVRNANVPATGNVQFQRSPQPASAPPRGPINVEPPKVEQIKVEVPKPLEESKKTEEPLKATEDKKVDKVEEKKEDSKEEKPSKKNTK